MIRVLLCVVLGVCARLSAQTEPELIVVDQRLRPGAHYSSFVDAVAAARPNGTVLVRAGAYGLPWRSPIVIDKPLRIIGFETVGGVAPGIMHPIEIRGLNAGCVVELRGLALHGSCFGQCNDGLQIHDCAGTVILDDVTVYGGPFPNRVVSIQRCEKVYLREVILDAGEVPILIEDAHVICERSALISGAWTFFGDPPPRTTVRLGRGADVTLIRSQIVGAGYWPGPQSALAMDGGIVRVDAMSTLASEPLVAIGVAPQGAVASGTIWVDPERSYRGRVTRRLPVGSSCPTGSRWSVRRCAWSTRRRRIPAAATRRSCAERIRASTCSRRSSPAR